jgi:hypothetical protein
LTDEQAIGGSLATNARGTDAAEEAKRIVRVAEDNRVTLRLIGGLAIRFHCHGPHSTHLREYHDIDVFGFGKEHKGIYSVFQKLGYSPNEEYNLLYGGTRLQFVHRESRWNVEVFLDKFRMGHTLDFRQRLQLDDVTIPITDLLLTKLQVVQFAEKDAKDIVAILEDHELGHNDDRETLNLDYVVQSCSRDWGLYKTITKNIATINKLIGQEASGLTAGKELVERLSAIRNALMTGKKGVRWIFRSLIGERVRWYREVETGQGEA